MIAVSKYQVLPHVPTPYSTVILMPSSMPEFDAPAKLSLQCKAPPVRPQALPRAGRGRLHRIVGLQLRLSTPRPNNGHHCSNAEGPRFPPQVVSAILQVVPKYLGSVDKGGKHQQMAMMHKNYVYPRSQQPEKIEVIWTDQKKRSCDQKLSFPHISCLVINGCINQSPSLRLAIHPNHPFSLRSHLADVLPLRWRPEKAVTWVPVGDKCGQQRLLLTIWLTLTTWTCKYMYVYWCICIHACIYMHIFLLSSAHTLPAFLSSPYHPQMHLMHFWLTEMYAPKPWMKWSWAQHDAPTSRVGPQSLHLIGLQTSECSGSRTLIALPSKAPAFGGVRNGISEWEENGVVSCHSKSLPVSHNGAKTEDPSVPSAQPDPVS